MRVHVWGTIVGLLGMSASGAFASSVEPTQLRGIREVSVKVYVSREVRGFAAIERTLEASATRILRSEGGVVTLNSTQPVFVFLDVEAYQVPCGTDELFLSIRLRVSEPAQIVRDPGIGVPGGHLATWSEERSGFSAQASARETIIARAESVVRVLASAIRHVNGTPE
jgi:hypothetical protein